MRLEALIGTDAAGKRETLAVGTTAEVAAAFKSAVVGKGVIGKRAFVAIDWMTPRATRKFQPVDDAGKLKKDKTLLG